MSTTTARLDLAIDVGSDPITGSLTLAGSEPCHFQGWIELTEAIESARRRRGGDADCRRHPGADHPAKRLGYLPGAKPGWV